MSSPRSRGTLPSSETLAGRIRLARLARGWRQGDLARHLRVSVDAVSAWERGEQHPRGDNATRLAAFLSIDSGSARSPLRAGDSGTPYSTPLGDTPVTPAGDVPPPLRTEAVASVVVDAVVGALAQVLRVDELDARERAAQIAEDIGILLYEKYDAPNATRLMILARQLRKGDTP